MGFLENDLDWGLDRLRKEQEETQLKRTYDYPAFVANADFTHGSFSSQILGPMGLNGEAGEVSEVLKKYLLHGQPLDREKLKKELGDVRWYYQHILNTYGFTDDEIIVGNVEKLCDRYPDQNGKPADWQIA